MDALLTRHASGLTNELLSTFPAVVIEGARQVGKSTFAQQLVGGRVARMLTLDDDAVRAAALEDPQSFVEQLPTGTLVIDELQRAPNLTLAIKAAIDRQRTPGRFLLTGSSDLLRLSRTPESLAGRAVTVRLRGLSQGELRQQPDDFMARIRGGVDAAAFSSNTTRSDYVSMIAQGGYPEAMGLTTRMRSAWFDGYVERILRRDVAEISTVSEPARLRAVLGLLAANQAGELVKARVARDANVPATTITGYLDLIETVFLSERLPAWTASLTRREVERPKVVVSDPGLALRLAKVTEQQLLDLTSAGFLGPALEGLVVCDLLKQRTWSSEEYELFHFRDRNGLEVDLVAEFADSSVVGLEVKSSATVKADHFAGLRALRDRLGDRFIGGIVLNTSTHGLAYGRKLWSLPVAALWELG